MRALQQPLQNAQFIQFEQSKIHSVPIKCLVLTGTVFKICIAPSRTVCVLLFRLEVSGGEWPTILLFAGARLETAFLLSLIRNKIASSAIEYHET